MHLYSVTPPPRRFPDASSVDSSPRHAANSAVRHHRRQKSTGQGTRRTHEPRGRAAGWGTLNGWAPTIASPRTSPPPQTHKQTHKKRGSDARGVWIAPLSLSLPLAMPPRRLGMVPLLRARFKLLLRITPLVRGSATASTSTLAGKETERFFKRRVAPRRAPPPALPT